MEFTIPRLSLLKLIEKVLPGLSENKDRPFCSQILIQVFADGITLTTNSIELIVKTFLPIKTDINLSFCVTGRLFYEVVKAMATDSISLSIKDEVSLKVRGGRKQLSLNISPEDIFPLSPRYENFTFKPIGDLLSAIDSVYYAAADDSTILEFCSVHVNKTEVVATNRHRMSICPLETPVQEKFTLPSTSLGKLRKTLTSDSLEMFITGSEVHLKDDSTVVSIRLIEREYANYQKVIPQGPYDLVKINKNEFNSALNLLSVMHTKDEKQFNVTLEIEDNIIKLSTKSFATGFAEEEIAAESSTSIKIGFDIRYLKDLVKHLKKDIIEVEVRGPLSPVMVKESGRIHVIMPKKIL